MKKAAICISTCAKHETIPPYTINHYENTVHNFALFYGLENKLSSVNKETVLEYVVYLKEKGLARHTFATRCIEAGIPPAVLKNWLGHKDIHITLDTYADVFDRMTFSAVSKLEEYIGAYEDMQTFSS